MQHETPPKEAKPSKMAVLRQLRCRFAFASKPSYAGAIVDG